MKVIYFCHTLAVKGGLEKILVNKMNYLSEYYGYEMYFVTSDQGSHPLAYELHSSVTHIDLNINFYQRFRYKIFKRFYLYWRMKREYRNGVKQLLDKINPDVLIFFTNALFEMKLVKSLHIDIPIVVESHCARNTVEPRRKFPSNVYYSILKKYHEKSVANVDVLVCLTNNDATLWKDIKNPIVIPNMINRPITCKKNFENSYRIICVGRLSANKGYDLLIDAWQKIHEKYSEWKIDVYGEGELEKEIRNKIKKAGITNIHLKGITDNINKEYLQSDFLVLSSKFEGFGLVLAEAMACGIPCVAFDCPFGPSDVIRDKEDGLLVENGNTVKLAEAISWMIDHDEERLKMGENAKKNIERYYPERIMPMWDNLFNDLLKKRKQLNTEI